MANAFEGLINQKVKVTTEKKEKIEGEGLYDLLNGDDRSAYIAGEYFKIYDPEGLSEKILKGKKLNPAEIDQSMRFREEIDGMKKDLERVFDLMKQGNLLQDLATYQKYFSDIRKRVGASNMNKVISFEDLVEARIFEERSFGQLKTSLENYQSQLDNLKTKDSKLDKLVDRYEISRYELGKLMKISKKVELEKAVEELVDSKISRLRLIRGFNARTLVREILDEVTQENRSLIKERVNIANNLRDIFESTPEMSDLIENNISRILGQVQDKVRKDLTFKEARSLYETTEPSIDEEFGGQEAEDKVAAFWGEKFRVQKAEEAAGRPLSESEVDNFWSGVSNAQLASYQDECFNLYKKDFKNRKLEPSKNQGSWYDRVVNIVTSILVGKTLDNVGPNCRSRMRRVK